MNSDRENVLIFANGMIEDLAWVEPYLAAAKAVIAADGGIRHPLALGRHPDMLIGDLDSLSEGMRTELAASAMEVVRHPPAKDETDLELVLLFAKQRFPDAGLLILGGFGGRLDHTLANVLLLAHPQLLNHPVRFVHGRESAWLVTAESIIDGRPGDIVSLIPLGGSVRIVSTTGLRWPLHDETLVFGLARGVSNEMTAEQAIVKVEHGMLLCVHRGSK